MINELLSTYTYTLFYLSLFLICTIPIFIINLIQIRRLYKQLDELLSQSNIVDANEFLKLRNIRDPQNRRQFLITSLDSPGVYILHNLTNNKYYVGQSVTVAKRAYAHLSGKGNGDVYADFKYNHNFTVQFVLLENAPQNIRTLNQLEKHMITRFDAFRRGYNRTRGNN